MELVFTTDGQVRCVYDEAIDLRLLGQLIIRRGSHVESQPDASWTADMSPVGGPVLGPFPRWSEAIAAEQDWLSRHWLTTNESARP